MTDKKENKPKKVKGLMKVLMITSYKSFPIYVRQVGVNYFLWDVLYNGLLYSSFLDIQPSKGKKKLSAKEVSEVVKMCYAGAVATIDNILGIKLSETDQDLVDKFEEAMVKVKSSDKGEA